VVKNNTVITTNTTGIEIRSQYGPIVENNIVWASGPNAFCIEARDIRAVSALDYNDLFATGGAKVGLVYSYQATTLPEWRAATAWDLHSISAGPLFANAAAGDFHLKSVVGRYDPANGWVMDTVTSPAIDAGNPADSVGLESSPNGGRINLGAYGGTVEASRSVVVARTVRIVAAKGGEIWNGIRPIEFLATGPGWRAGDTLRLEYWSDYGASWQLVPNGANVPYSRTRFWWDTRPLPDRYGYLLRVTAVQNRLVSDVSDNPFAIVNGIGASAFASVSRATNGVMQMTLVGSTNSVYTIYASTNLVTWTPMKLVTNVPGLIQFTDPCATNFSRRFYQARLGAVPASQVDCDADGMSDDQELSAGTNPYDPNSLLRIVHAAKIGLNMVISFTSATNKTYALECRASFGAGGWTNLLNNLQGNGAILTVTNSGAALPNAFYRVRVGP
jgi:hypothetical protein